MTKKTPVILDCDPGLDDTFAILLALASRAEIDLLGITTVAGNVGLRFTSKNALGVCEMAGVRDVPVFAGCARASMGRGSRAPEIHGEDGMGGAELPTPQFNIQKQHAVDFIIETCLSAGDGEIVICPVGPMTNVALAIIKEPLIIPKIKEIVFMGGAAFKGGNITAYAEFNIHADPHAAEVVLQSGAPCVMFGLDVTHQAVITDERLHDINHIGGDIGPVLAHMMAYYARTTKKAGGEKANGVLHDPCVVAYLIDPDIFSGGDYYVYVETQAGHNEIGNTVVDEAGTSGRPVNTKIITQMDDTRFYELLINRISNLVKQG